MKERIEVEEKKWRDKWKKETKWKRKMWREK